MTNSLSIFYLCGLWFIFGIVIGYNGEDFAKDFNSVFATILEKESSPLQTNDLTTTNDTDDIDLSISVDDMEEDALFENKTQSLSRGDATDIDIDGFPPKDVTVVITSEKVFVTRSPIELDLTDEILDELKRQIADDDDDDDDES